MHMARLWKRPRHHRRLAALAVAFGLIAAMAHGGEPPFRHSGDWILLPTNPRDPAWSQPTGQWFEASEVQTTGPDASLLTGTPGPGILVNGPTGKTSNLTTRRQFGSVEFECEFLIPRGSNAGVKFEGLYEIQIRDSFGVNNPDATHSGGIYPRAQLEPNYHYLDSGHPPLVNAARPAGEWQTLSVHFCAPEFDLAGVKVANARIALVLLNGQTVQKDVELATPTGHAWTNKEIPSGPILFQADHGPVAFRNVRVRPLSPDEVRQVRSQAEH
jgi:hypothetical protein